MVRFARTRYSGGTELALPIVAYLTFKKIRPRFPEAPSYTARGVHPAVLPSWFHIVMAIGGVKLPAVPP
jgi:hypothetical protein